MGMLSLLAKLEQVKDFVTTEVPEALDWTANLLEQVSDGMKEAAVFLRDMGTNQVTGEEARARVDAAPILDQLEASFISTRAKNFNAIRATGGAEQSQKIENRKIASTCCDLMISVIQNIRGRI